MSAERILALNDAFRRSFAGGKVMMTAGIAVLSVVTKSKVLEEVRMFDAFTAENDPHGEHDFGSFAVDGRKLFWKIDLYEEPGVKGADGLPLTTRVLTIMLAEEW
jgi:acetylornithine/succinyldiaminopimelate/putrescine aminotransferase